MLGFDDYPDIAARLRSIVAGEAHHAHTPQDRRKLLPDHPGGPGDLGGRPQRPGPGRSRVPYAAGSTAARWPR